MNKESWEEEFDKEFYLIVDSFSTEYTDEIKAFISKQISEARMGDDSAKASHTPECIRCNDNGCPACESADSPYNPDGYHKPITNDQREESLADPKQNWTNPELADTPRNRRLSEEPKVTTDALIDSIQKMYKGEPKRADFLKYNIGYDNAIEDVIKLIQKGNL